MSNQQYNWPRAMPIQHALPLQPPRPIYFITRSTGLLVPLVPADELPFNIRLHGVPRAMRVEDTQANGMQMVGLAHYTGATYKLEREVYPNVVPEVTEAPAVPIGLEGLQRLTAGQCQDDAGVHMPGHGRSQYGGQPVQTSFLAPDALARQAIATQTVVLQGFHNSTPPRPASAHETSTSWRSNFNPTPSTPAPLPTKPSTTTSATTPPPFIRTGNKTQDLLNAIASTTSGARIAAELGYTHPSTSPLSPSGAQPDAEKKQYCTYWIRTGECDYMQQGCLYKHEMPDRATLETIGFLRGTPRWFSEKQGLLGRVGGEGKKVLVSAKSLVAAAAAAGQKEDGSGDCGESASRGIPWLRKPMADSAQGSDGGSVTSGSESESELIASPRSSAENVQEPSSMQNQLAKPFIPAPVKRVDFKEVLNSINNSSKAVNAANPAPTTPPTIEIRKASTCSDLISFADLDAIPLTPPPTPALTPDNSSNTSRSTTPLIPQVPTFLPITAGASKHKTTQVFIPKGESVKPHIAEIRKRQQQSRHRSAPVFTLGPVEPMQKQILQRQRKSAQLGTSEAAKDVCVAQAKLAEPTVRKFEDTVLAGEVQKGLLASQPAPKIAAAETKSKKMETGIKTQLRKTACRARRPAAVVKVAKRD
ncbi:hypothetical protein LTR62_008426 [Meristemomyces frigidus]|uniref:C3H1-type domain-containing protein n=1 Tax=Meristemomyces frigidus TaxID=1508187 RepID=A0AAN7TAX8_9PEZI|nr:hypothetical protein LTR62_008426 [Meristemomyces frigidus]